jgi:hypothetical protein
MCKKGVDITGTLSDARMGNLKVPTGGVVIYRLDEQQRQAKQHTLPTRFVWSKSNLVTMLDLDTL